ncbi:2Fe-2S iron-sulfur cluster binding domain protein [Planctomycetes bacterium Pan216]|uniref:2Fe-2S iron-sulfur cluster binding domain protein n=1 Tax=Kolteria novifilia TaxID=2527975 RepID=A0A518AXL4_9BACT|nr:2Fe-2S iron-sulfur cluster binding domain protein [Planctomycetes bacterium Pan216]
MPKITFVKEKKEIEVEEGANLREVALANEVGLHHVGLGADNSVATFSNSIASYTNCSRTMPFLGGGHCGTCSVLIKKGAENCSPKSMKEKIRLAVAPSAIGREDEMRLSCQVKVTGDIEVETMPAMNLTGDAFFK